MGKGATKGKQRKDPTLTSPCPSVPSPFPPAPAPLPSHTVKIPAGIDAWHVLVTDLQGPPSERTQMEKIRDLKSLARQYARDRGSCDDTRISYLEYVESEAEADWTLARMIAG
jgi:hypothetical protein